MEERSYNQSENGHPAPGMGYEYQSPGGAVGMNREELEGNSYLYNNIV